MSGRPGVPSRNRLLLLLAVAGLTALAVSGSVAVFLHPVPTLSVQAGQSPAPALAADPSAGLSLGIETNPRSICAFDEQSCPAAAGESRVTLTAQATALPTPSWPAVQIAFVLDTAAYDGDFDPTTLWPGYDPCSVAAPLTGPLCEESNGLAFFTTNAQQIATDIANANPHTQVSFALVDYHATYDQMWDDGDAPNQYHVDISDFVPADEFGSAVQSTFVASSFPGAWGAAGGTPGAGRGFIAPELALDDSFLHTDVVTALYGAIVGSGLNWSEGTHHVIVLMGDGAPRAPGYSQDYCISGSSYNGLYGWGPATGVSGPACYSGTCEPSFSFGTVSSPPCEGWTTSQDGNANDSIAGLTKSSPTCTDALGGSCTIDVIDYYDGITDPYSSAWPTQYTSEGGGPGGPLSIQNSLRQLEAGCALAEATGGSWDGPSFYSCSDGQSGNLVYVPIGSPFAPNTENPGLLGALRQISFGPIVSTLAASGTSSPMFRFAPYGNIELAPSPQFQTECTTSAGGLWTGGSRCPSNPENLTSEEGAHSWGWNWSSNASLNQMYIGDTWSVSFWVIADGPPYGEVPVDACTTLECRFGGSGEIGGIFSSAAYLPPDGSSPVLESFPLGTVNVEGTANPVPPPPVAATPPPPPSIPASPPIPISVQSPVGVSAQIGVSELALQATAVGFLVGSAIRVSQRNRPIATAVTAISGKPGRFISKFDSESFHDGTNVGRFE
ncbi:MAG: hypothetical protein L3K03_07070 [Thermoplasmata archaeon]|nr:hypothetical protein [Thermoplasmata archaeon]